MPAEDAPEAEPAPDEGDLLTADQRSIIRVASIDLVVTDVTKAASDLRTTAAGVGGMVTAESLTLPEDESASGNGTSRMVISVPAAQLDRTLTLLTDIGEVKNRSIESTDVTDTVVDAESRTKTMRESVSRLQSLMSKAGSIREIAEVESELTTRQADLEALLAKLNSISRQVEMSPITVTLHTPDTVVPEPPSSFLSSLQASWESLLGVGGWLLTALGALLPYLAVAAVVATPVVWWRRRAQATAATVAPAALIAGALDEASGGPSGVPGGVPDGPGPSV